MNRHDWDDLLPWGFGVLVAGLIALCIWLEVRWARYAEKHHCVEIGRRMGYYYPVTISDGKTTTIIMQYSGDVVTYQCDNGIVVR